MLARFLAWWKRLFGAGAGTSAVSALALDSAAPGNVPAGCNVTFHRTEKGKVWTMGSPAHRAWQKGKLSGSDFWTRLFAEIAGNEGSSSSYQNYDNQGVTLGAGYGARGMLGSYAKRLNMPEVLPLPADGNRYSADQLVDMGTEEWGKRYVCAAESPELRDRILQAQIATFRASKERYGLPQNNFPVAYLIAHLAHWYPAFVSEGGWTGNDSVDVPGLLGEFRAKAKAWTPPVTIPETQLAIYTGKYKKLGGTHVFEVPRVA